MQERLNREYQRYRYHFKGLNLKDGGEAWVEFVCTPDEFLGRKTRMEKDNPGYVFVLKKTKKVR